MPVIHGTSALVVVLLLIIAIPAAAEVTPGRIMVYSTPSGALACVDNADCDTTADSFMVAGNAWHTVVVTQKGYLQWSEQVYVTADQTSVVSAYLELNPATNAVQVFVTPGGGTICLDNRDCRVGAGSADGTASVQFTGVSEGYHTVSVEAPPGYEDDSELVYANLGQIAAVSIQLEPASVPVIPTTPPLYGSVRVYIDHAGSTVCLDNGDCRINVGGSSGTGTATTVFDDVPANLIHSITVAADGYAPFSTTIPVSADQVATVDVTLQPVPEESPLPTLTPVVETTPEPTPLPTRAGPGLLPVLGAIALCCVIVIAGKDRH